ncbi:MAG: thioesterase [Candidatus Dadabacteria bacterium]
MAKMLLKEAGKSPASFFSLIKNPLKFRLYLLKSLPAAYFAGLKLKQLDEDHSIVVVPYKWFTKNPFRSTYFACLAMAGELSTGILAMGHIHKTQVRVSMLILSIEGKFMKKATGDTMFICNQGNEIKQNISMAISTGEPKTFKACSSGYNSNGELIAEFNCEWSFMVKKTP